MIDPAAVRTFIESLEQVVVDDSTPDTFFFREPDRMIPFATIITRDPPHEQLSDLTRRKLWRLNLGVKKETFQALFPEPDAKVDEAALDRFFPHPDYAAMHFVCIVEQTFEKKLKPMLLEARAIKGAKAAKKKAATKSKRHG
jgi:hypothetical protein